MPKHENTLGNYGVDPTDPMAREPVSADVSLGTYGAYWKYSSRLAVQFLFDFVDRSSYGYRSYNATAPDAFGAYTDFGFQTYFIWFSAAGDVVVDYTRNGVNSWLVVENKRQYLIPLSIYGFRIRNNVAGSNIPYQLVVWR